MLLDPLAVLLLGVIVLVFHYLLKWNYIYLNSLPGSKIFNERIENKIKNNKKLTIRDRVNIFYNKVFEIIISISFKIGIVLLVLGIVLKIISKLKG